MFTLTRRRQLKMPSNQQKSTKKTKEKRLLHREEIKRKVVQPRQHQARSDKHQVRQAPGQVKHRARSGKHQARSGKHRAKQAGALSMDKLLLSMDQSDLAGPDNKTQLEANLAKS
ncbi:unnamed protein product [Lupinus luteus]|uniref:Uncharacterized protein n=1 Tax=Lupinus luteus TaxID=3873 RepID=A0AAV1Y0N0_LUPLU